MLEKEFEVYCAVCETYTNVFVMDCDEEPAFCPMCGTEADVREMGGEDSQD